MRKSENVKGIAKEILETVIENLKSGTVEKWNNPVDLSAFAFYNPVSKSVYSGKNILRLAAWAKKNGSEDPRFITFCQARSKGFRIKKGAKGIILKKWLPFKKDDEDGESAEMSLFPEKKAGILKTFVVFNGKDVDGMPDLPKVAYTEFEKNSLLENMIKNSEAEIMYDAAIYGVNCYTPISDKVHLFPRENFNSAGEFYATAAHEIAHSTSAAPRLKRGSIIANTKKGTKTYAKEELIAELTAALIRVTFGGEVGSEHIKNHIAYLESWGRIIKDDEKTAEDVINSSVAAFEYIKEKMIFKNIDIKSYEERIKELPDLPDVQTKEDEKKAPRRSTEKKEKTEPVAALALPKTIKREITLGRKKKEKKFSVIVRKKDDGDYIPF